MDPISLAYYAVVCGLLGVASPWLGGLPVRLLIGGIVGVAAGFVLPYVQGLLGAASYATGG